MHSQSYRPMTDKAYLEQLIAKGEHQQQDFKYKVQDAVKLARSVSAFANTEGGRLLIGVRDDGVISGVKSEEEIFMMHAAAYKYCEPESAITFETFHVEGRSVVIATIPPAKQRPIYAIDAEGKKCAYIRIADENIVASPVHLEVWRQLQKAQNVMEYGTAAQTLMTTMREHPDETLNRLARLSHINRHTVITLLARFVRYGLVDCVHQDQDFVFRLQE